MQEHETIITAEDEKKHEHKVTVTVDQKERHVEPGSYVVADFKKLVKVDASLQLEQVVNGELVPLEDSTTIKIEGGEVFISHVRQGGSS